MHIDLTSVAVALITLLTAIVTRFVIPYLRGKIDDNKRNEIVFWTKMAVWAAEKIFKEHGMGAQKKAYVKAFLESKGFTFSDDDIDIAIESAVLEMQNALLDGSNVVV